MSFNVAVNALTRPDFDRALINFRTFLKLGAPTCLGPGASCPPCPLSAALLTVFKNNQFQKELIMQNTNICLNIRNVNHRSAGDIGKN